jgi:glutathione S-transferase
MLTVYSIPGAWGLPSLSPFCTKLIYWLDLAQVEYELKAGDMRRSPSGKVPYVDLDGEIVADTHVIIPLLTQRLGRGLLDDIPPAPRAVAHAALRVAEDSLYWAVVHTRWARDDGWAHLRPEVEKLLPKVVSRALIHVIRRRALRQLHQVGISRLPEEEVFSRAERDLDALVGLLGQRPFIAGDEVTVYDAAACAVLASILLPTFPSPLKELTLKRPELGAWVDRLEALRRR